MHNNAGSTIMKILFVLKAVLLTVLVVLLPYDLITAASQPGILWTFLVILFLGLSLALIYYHWPYVVATKALYEDTEKVEPRLFNASIAFTQVPDEQMLKLEKSGAQLEGVSHRRFRLAWKSFLRAWGNSCAGDPMAGQSTVSPADFFTAETILGWHSGTLRKALPGIFTAVGLLGTFIGIAMGLTDIALQESDEDLRQSINTLLGGMSTAFLTSIMGITYSVLLQFAFRTAEHKFKAELNNFLAEITRVIRFEEPHQTLIRVAQANENFGHSAVQIQDTAEQIRGSIQYLGSDMANALEPHLERHIGVPIRKLHAEFDLYRKEAVERIVEVFRKTLRTAIGNELNSFSQSIREASYQWGNASVELQRLFDRIVKVSDAQVTLLDRTTQVSTVFERGMDAITAATRAIESVGESASQTMEATRDTLGVARALSKETRQILEVQEKLSDVIQRSIDAQTSLIEEVKSIFGRLATDLGGQVTEFQTVSVQKIREIFHDFDSEMAQVVDHLGGTLSELRTVTEDLPTLVSSLRESIQGLVDAGHIQQNTLEEKMREVGITLARIVEQVEPARGEVRDLERMLDKLSGEINLHKEAFATSAQSTQSAMYKMISALEEEGIRSNNRSRDASGVRMPETGNMPGAAKVRLAGAQTAVAAGQLDRSSQQTGRPSEDYGDPIGVDGRPRSTGAAAEAAIRHTGPNSAPGTDDKDVNRRKVSAKGSLFGGVRKWFGRNR